MKKKIVLAMTLLSAAGVVLTPMTSYAAQGGAVQIQSGECYQVFGGQDLESLQEKLDELGVKIYDIWSSCPLPEIPDTGCPGTESPAPEAPVESESETDTPDTETPDTETPDEVEPGTGTPTPEAPDKTEPGTGTPDTEAPDEMKPGTSTPSPGQPDETAASYAEQVAALVNAERAKAGLPALELMTDLSAAADIRAKEIKQSFSHTRPNGSSFSTVLKEQGISYRGSGENIAYGQLTPEQVMKGWMNSEGHRANILNANYKNIGVGFYQDERGVNYWVQLFTY